MKIFKIIFIFFAFFSYAFSQSHVAILKDNKGEVSVKQGNKLVNSKPGFELFIDDIVITKADSSVNIIFDEGSILTLGENSFLSINSYTFKPLKGEFDFDLTLEKGTAIFTSGKIGKLSPQSFKMRFPEGIVGIRGTKFLLRVN